MKVYNLYYCDCLSKEDRIHIGTYSSMKAAEDARQKDIDSTAEMLVGTVCEGLNPTEEAYQIVEQELV